MRQDVTDPDEARRAGAEWPRPLVKAAARTPRSGRWPPRIRRRARPVPAGPGSSRVGAMRVAGDEASGKDRDIFLGQQTLGEERIVDRRRGPKVEGGIGHCARQPWVEPWLQRRRTSPHIRRDSHAHDLRRSTRRCWPRRRPATWRCHDRCDRAGMPSSAPHRRPRSPNETRARWSAWTSCRRRRAADNRPARAHAPRRVHRAADAPRRNRFPNSIRRRR